MDCSVSYFTNCIIDLSIITEAVGLNMRDHQTEEADGQEVYGSIREVAN